MSSASYSWSAAPIQMENNVGFLYSMTHLHPTIYLILFFVFLLSMVNLVVQSPLLTKIGSFFIKLWGKASRDSDSSGGLIRNIDQSKRPKNFRQSIRGPESYRMSKEPLQDGIVSVRPALPNSTQDTDDLIPTPLDGEDHPIPEFAASPRPRSKASKTPDAEKEKSLLPKEFKFSSAVDLPSPKEIERREKEKVVVTGRIVDQSSRGLSTAVVYLVDKDGNKVGQSCRTNSDNGNFRVQANESGAYAINVYKRGYLMNSEGPIKLPVQNGKIEDFDITMLPEGCLIHGKVLSSADLSPISGLQVNCSCRSEQFTFSTITNSNGAFQAIGAPLNSECVIKILGHDGKVVLDSKPFETVQKKQIFMEFKVEHPGDNVVEALIEDFDNIDVVIGDSESDPTVQSSAL